MRLAHRRNWIVCFLSLLLAAPANAHVGSKDVYEQVDAGPYKLFVTIRTPNVIPGVASIEVRSTGATIRSIRITPVPLTGEAAKHPPTSDAMQASPSDPAYFTGSLWLMAAGSWQVRFEVEGTAGKASAGVPVPAMPLSILPMQRSMGIMLALLGALLMAGIVGIVAAAIGQSRIEPGAPPDPKQRTRAMIASIATLAITILIVYGGYVWWNAEATAYAADVYHPLSLTPTLAGNTLDLKIGRHDVDALHRSRARQNDDLLPDHGHVMHLYAIREPQMDAAFHLHPAPLPNGDLQMTLPAMPAGTYRLYADIVHRNGFPETLTAELTGACRYAGGGACRGRRVRHAVRSIGRRVRHSVQTARRLHHDLGPPADLSANAAQAFRFRLLDTTGNPAADARPYLGMAGHAAFVKTDGSVFAHTHPEGSAAMQAMMLANGGSGEMADSGSMGGMDMATAAPSSASTPANISPVVEFPYGFPTPGRYRIFIQMKHGNTVETGVFDANVR